MPLSCNCAWDDGPEFWIWQPEDYSEMPQLKRRRRCSSCHTVIEPGAVVAQFKRSRDARSDVELRIYGEGDPQSVWFAPWYLCEECADLYFSLHELGFECVSAGENMRELVREYALINEEERHARANQD